MLVTMEHASATCRMSAIVHMPLSGSGAEFLVFDSYAAGYGFYAASFSPGFVRNCPELSAMTGMKD